jgi:myxalamid-type polyketide synthase MxaE and MxaD
VGHTAVFPIDWSKFQQAQVGQSPLLLADLLQQEGDVETQQADEQSFRQQLEVVGSPQREEIFATYLQKQIAQILKMDSRHIEPDTPMGKLGFDSLMALKFRTQLEKELGLTLSATLVFNYPTIQEMIPYLLNKMSLNQQKETTPTSPSTTDGVDTQEFVAEIEALSEEDALKALLGEG